MAIIQPRPIQQAPKKRSKSFLEEALPAVGAVAGGVLGAVGTKTPLGAAKGAAAGASAGLGLGTAATNLFSPQASADLPQQPQGMQSLQTSDSSIARRMQAQQDDPLKILREAQEAIAALPPAEQAQYQQPIGLALTRLQDQRRV